MPDPAPLRTRAAQYVRMSTDQQTHSLGHQRAANAAYADAHGYEIVTTYADEGISGLTLDARPGLKRLLADVLGGAADFSAVLTYDVSRWGRFQDPDQSAHYEFLCKDAGAPVIYCAEPFTNDGGVAATLIKSLKRVMAAEYSRELSVKVSRAQARLAAAGLWQGGPPGYALRRCVIGEDGAHGRMLVTGEGKPREGRVVLAPGPVEEQAVVRRIFELFVHHDGTRRAIARTLNAESIAAEAGAQWTGERVSQVLRNEKYVGVMVFGKTQSRLGVHAVHQDSARWVRAPLSYPPMVSARLFAAAQRRIARQFRRRPRDQMIEGLQALLAKAGKLNSALIRADPAIPCPGVYQRRFGSLLTAYQLAGYEPPIRVANSTRAHRARRNQGHRVSSRMTPDQMLASVRRLFAQHGRLSVHIINDAPGGVSSDKLAKTFGGLIAVYEAVGYTPTRKQLATAYARAKFRRQWEGLDGGGMDVRPAGI